MTHPSVNITNSNKGVKTQHPGSPIYQPPANATPFIYEPGQVEEIIVNESFEKYYARNSAASSVGRAKVRLVFKFSFMVGKEGG